MTLLDVGPKSLQGQYAGFASRAVAFVLDLLILAVAFAMLGFVVNALLTFFGLRDLPDILSIIGTMDNQLGSFIRLVATIGSLSTVTFLYTVLLWVFAHGQTVGKAVVGLRVVRLDGRHLTLLNAIARYFMYFVSIFCFGLGILWVLVDDRRQGWHDKVARTCVIYDWPAREDERFLRGIGDTFRRWNERRRRLLRRRPSPEPLPPPTDPDQGAGL